MELDVKGSRARLAMREMDERDKARVMIYVRTCDNTQNNEQICSLSGEKQINSVAFSPDGSLIAAGDGGLGDEGTIRLYNAATGDPFGSPLTGHQSLVSSVHFSPDGKRLVSGSYDNTVMVWDPSTGEQLCQLRGHTDVVTSVCFSSDGKELASGSQDSTVRNWDPATRASLS